MQRNDLLFCYGCFFAGNQNYPGYPTYVFRCSNCLRNPGHTRVQRIMFKTAKLEFLTVAMDNYLGESYIIDVENIFGLMNDMRRKMEEREFGDELLEE